MNKIIMFAILINTISYGNQLRKEGIFKTMYYYGTNLKVAEKRAKECQTLNEMTFAIERDCENAKIAFNRANRSKARREFIKQDFLRKNK